jgi:HSP20 family protein
LADIKLGDLKMNTLVKTNGKMLSPTTSKVPSFFENFWNNDWMNFMNDGELINNSLPAVNIHEQKDRYQLEVAAPGMVKDDFNIELENNTLSISAHKENEQETQMYDGKYNRREFSYQSFRRSFTLPENLIEGDKISAQYKDGILSIDIPKTKEAIKKATRQIKIQ